MAGNISFNLDIIFQIKILEDWCFSKNLFQVVEDFFSFKS